MQSYEIVTSAQKMMLGLSNWICCLLLSLPILPAAYALDGPDLLVSDSSVLTQVIAIGSEFNVSYTIRNAGNVPASGEFVTDLLLSTDSSITSYDANLDARVYLQSLGVGESHTVNLVASIPAWLSPGMYYLGVITDNESTVNEADETNNVSLIGSVEVVQHADLTTTSVSISNSEIPIGSTISATYSVTNIGDSPVFSGTTTELVISSDDVISADDIRIKAAAQLPSLAANETYSGVLQAVIPGWLTPGAYYVGVISDVNNDLAEIDETNNALKVAGVINITDGGAGPVITISSPQDGLVTNNSQVAINGALDTQATLTVNNQSIELAADNSFSTIYSLQEGVNELVFVAVGANNISSTHTLFVTLDSILPAPINQALVTISEPSNGIVEITGQAGAAEAGTSVIITNISLSQNVTVMSTDDGSFSTPLEANPSDQIEFVVRDQAMNSSTPVIMLVEFTYIMIDSPVMSQTIEGSHVNVQGQFQAPINSGITVNGVIAQQSDGRFYVNNLRLGDVNTITVVLTTAQGSIYSDDVQVNSISASAFTLDTNKTSGYPPFDTTFSINNHRNENILSVAIDFETDGTVDYSSNTNFNGIIHTYSEIGVYTATAEITTSNQIYTVAAKIVVVDLSVIEQRIVAAFDTLVDALQNQNIDAALGTLSPSLESKFEQIFTLNFERLPEIASQLGSISGGRLIGDDLAELVIIKQQDGVNVGYKIYIKRDIDGVWRISDM